MKIKLFSLFITLSLIVTLLGPALPAAGQGRSDPGLPDLVVSSIAEEWLVDGETYEIHYEVTNAGNAIATAGHQITLYVDGIEIAHQEVPLDLAGGQTFEGCFSDVVFSPPADDISVCIYSLDAISESNEDNNCLEYTFILLFLGRGREPDPALYYLPELRDREFHL